MRSIGIKGYLFSLLGEWAERKLGEQVGVKPGTEMLTAVQLAKERKKELALIAQPIEITLRKLNKAIGWKEKCRFFWDVLKSIFQKKQELPFDLKTVPDEKVIKKLTERVKKDYPRVYAVLVEERNQYMAEQLAQLLRQYPNKKILAIVGAGHEEEMLTLIKEKGNVPLFSYSFSMEED